MAKSKSKPKTLSDLLWNLMTSDAQVAGRMARVVAWAKKDRELKKGEIWKAVPDMDFSKAVARVSKWTMEALKKLPKAPRADIIHTLLGESSEYFWVQALPYSGGRDKLEEFAAVLRKRPWLNSEEGDWDRQRDLLYAETSELPGKIWRLGPFNPDRDYREIDSDSAFVIWHAVAFMGFAHALRHGKLNFPKLLGKRKLMPILLGYTEEPLFIGTLTPEGWDTTR